MYGDVHGGRRHHVLDLVRTAGPRGPLLRLAEARKHLSYGETDRDAELLRHIATATKAVDGYSGTLGRCILEQRFTLYLDRFPHEGWPHWPLRYGPRELTLPLPPLIAVGAVTYTDTAGQPQTLDPSTYVVCTGPRASVALKAGKCWPQTSCDPRSVAIDFRCGYLANPEGPGAPDPASLDEIQPIRSAALLIVGDLFFNKEAVVITETRATQILSPTAEALLAPFRAEWL